MRNKAKLLRQQALERAQEAKCSPLSDKTNLTLAKSNIHDLKERINSLDTELSETQTALTRSDELLKRIRKRSKHHLIWNHNARKAMKCSKNIILGLRGKNRTQLSVNEGLRNDMDEFKNKLTEKEGELSSCQLQANSYLQAVASANLQALGYWNELQVMQDKNLMLLKRIAALTHRVSRMQEAAKRIQKLKRIEAAVKSLLQLRQNGAYLPWVHSLVLRIALLGCPAKRVGEIIDSFIRTACNRLGITQKKKIQCVSPRTVGQIVSEADIAGKLQLAYEMKRTPSFTIGGDGTMHKNQTFESMHVNFKTKKSYLNEDGTSCTSEEQVQRVRFIKLERAGNHRAETQKNETIACLREAVDIFNKSLLASANNVPGWLFNEQEMLSEDERIQKDAEIFEMLCKSLSDEAFEQLSEMEKRHLNMWVWAGCGMHKDLNAVKGGDSAMQEKWKEIKDSPGTVLLENRDNAAILEPGADNDDDEYEDIGDSAMHVLPSFEYKGRGAKRGSNRKETAAQKRAHEVSKAGSKKLMDLMGDMLKNRNDKKGHQHTFQDFALFTLDRIINFPGTSNTRYSSYLEAAAETIARLQFYINYMHYIRDSKEKRTLNHLEANVLKGLEDIPTLTELAILALYQEAISHSYISMIRGPGLENTNALDLGPLHEKVRTHVKKLIEDPQIILSPRVDPLKSKTKAWERTKSLRPVPRCSDWFRWSEWT
ncbi:hypothetical protein ACEPAI_4485 [Sanghuangporus weigelae]